MPGRLEGKVAIVTGAGTGLGRAEALQLAREGAAVVVNNRAQGPADEVVAEIKAAGGRAVANYDVVGTMEAGRRIAATAMDTFGRLDIVVNNAGFARDRMAFNMTDEEWESVIGVHLTGTFAVCRAAAPIFKAQRWGRIVNTSSDAGLGVTIGQCNYAAAKEGIIGLTRTLSLDLGKYGVTVNSVRPSAATRMNTSAEMWEVAKKSAAMGQPNLLRAMHTRDRRRPEHCSPFVAWLCTDAAAHINGRDFYITGPLVALYSKPERVRTVFAPHDIWSLDELDDAMKDVTFDLVNPAPPEVK